MAYQNFYYNRQDGMCYIWDDTTGMAQFPYEPYAYQIDPKGEYTTLTGLKVNKTTFWSKEAEKQGMIFEHDVPVPTRVLIDHYFESDEPSKNHRILFFDIEVEKGLKYSTAAEALNTITSIAYYFDGKYVCLLLDQEGNLEKCTKTVTINGHEINVAVLVFRHERELLMTFLKHWETINPTIVSGWNSDIFDCPYLYNRICNVLGKQYGSRLSPIKIVYQRPLNKRDVSITIAGVSQMDYMNLYKEFTYNEESSYSLDAISKKELQRGKYVYEGTLDRLFSENIDGFIEYNVNDVELLVALDNKMDLIEIARGICHKGHVPYEDFVYPSSYLEGAVLNRCKQMGVISTSNLEKSIDYEIKKSECYIKDKRTFTRLDKYTQEIKDNAKIYELDEEGEYNLIGQFFVRKQNKKKAIIVVTAKKAKGAFVKPPKPGLHDWIYSIDLQSLYPSLIRTGNISPETQMYFIENWPELHMVNKMIKDDGITKLSDYENFNFLPDSVELNVQPIIKELFSERDAEIISMDKSKFVEFMQSNKFTISAAGVIYRTDIKGIIPTILEEWFNERLEYKKLAKENKDNPDLYQYYDRKQLITKILLNSLYGVLLLPTFRYYDKKNGESVTLSGQSVIKFSDIIGTQYYRKMLNNPKFESPVIAGDTDSGYFSAMALIDPTKPEDEIIKDVADISNKLTEIINKSISWLSTHHLCSDNNQLRFMQEKLIRRAVWGQAKKRYALLTIDGEMVVKGFDLVRSSFPKIFRKKQTEIIEEMLSNKGREYLDEKVRAFHKNDYKNSSIFDIMLPSSVKELSKYEGVAKGTPIHVKSAQNYNKLLNLHKIDSIPLIDDGDKIVYAYMQQNPFGFETMALKGQGEDPEVLVEFVERFIDKERLFQTTFISKLDTIWHDLGWGKVQQEEPNQFF